MINILQILILKLHIRSFMVFHIRRKDREITINNQLKEALKTAPYITIALCKNNEPYLVSLSHGYDEKKNCLYFHCASNGKKIDYLKSNNKVWGQAVQVYKVKEKCDYDYASVHFKGIIFLINDLSEKQTAMQVMIRQRSPNPEEYLKKVLAENLAKTTMGKIEISYITGKKNKD